VLSEQLSRVIGPRWTGGFSDVNFEEIFGSSGVSVGLSRSVPSKETENLTTESNG
jgi:hypothetical protein